jgi:hypothetical protein
VSLAWNDTSSAESHFEIEYRLNDTNASWLPGGTVNADVTSATVSGLTKAQPYQFRVRARTGVIQSAWSTLASAVTLP